MTSENKNIEFNQESFNRFEKIYDEAKKDGKESFFYEGALVDMGYAKYMREHLMNCGLTTCLK